jgi:hypothetical protein
MLEVVENRGAILRLKGALIRLIERKGRFGRGLVSTNTRKFTIKVYRCQGISVVR